MDGRTWAKRVNLSRGACFAVDGRCWRRRANANADAWNDLTFNTRRFTSVMDVSNLRRGDVWSSRRFAESIVNCICFLCASIPLHLVAFRTASNEPSLFSRFNAAYCRARVVPCIPSSSPSCSLSAVVRGAPFIRPPRIHDVTITLTSYHPSTRDC